MLFGLIDSRPFLTGDNGVYHWETGRDAFLIGGSSAIRVNYRSLRSYSRLGLRELGNLGWTSLACNLSSTSLCSSVVGQVFPVVSPTVAENSSLLLEGWRSLRCDACEGLLISSSARYDITACNVLGQGLDVVYSNGVVYHKQTELSPPVYWILIAICLYLVRCLSYNVKELGQREHSHQFPALLACVTVFFLVVEQGDSMYITEEDRLFFWFSALYMLVYLGYHTCIHLGTHEGMVSTSIYNLIAVSLQLVVSRLYTGAETPYNPVILIVICTR